MYYKNIFIIGRLGGLLVAKIATQLSTRCTAAAARQERLRCLCESSLGSSPPRYPSSLSLPSHRRQDSRRDELVRDAHFNNGREPLWLVLSHDS